MIAESTTGQQNSVGAAERSLFQLVPIQIDTGIMSGHWIIWVTRCSGSSGGSCTA